MLFKNFHRVPSISMKVGLRSIMEASILMAKPKEGGSLMIRLVLDPIGGVAYFLKSLSSSIQHFHSREDYIITHPPLTTTLISQS